MPTDGTRDRAYLHVRPTEDGLAGARSTEQFEQLHAALDSPIEVLLVADPAADEVRYYLGADSRTLPSLDRALARLLPDTYAIERIDADPLAAFPWPDDDREDDADGADDTDPASLAAVEFQGVGERHDDWQPRLRPPRTSDAPEQHQTARVADAPGLRRSLTALDEPLGSEDMSAWRAAGADDPGA